MGGLSWCPIGYTDPKVKECYLIRPSLIHVVNMIWMGLRPSGHGVLDISRDHIVSFMGAFEEGVLHPSFAMQPFSKPFYFPLIYCGPKH
jgi:hypothetical protein